MYKQNKPEKTTISTNTSYIGERIEEKIERIINNKEPITDSSPSIFTERKDGVQPQYNIRTDRWDIAIEAMDKVTQSHQASRENKASIGQEAKKNMDIENKNKDGGAKPIQATE